MKIAFFAERSIPIHATTLNERPLGGIETGIIRLAEALAKNREHTVYVFTTHKNPVSSPVQYAHTTLLQTKMPFDVLVIVQDWSGLMYGFESKLKFFWTGDGFDQYLNFGIGDQRVVKACDAFLAVSSWQAGTLCQKSSFPWNKTYVIGNGVHLPYFEHTAPEREPYKIVYASAPNRGLALLPEIFTNIKKTIPNASLSIYSGFHLYDKESPFQGPEVEQFKQLSSKLLSLDGVSIVGNLLQKELANELLKSSLLTYPNQIFETSCIVAMEAQAAGVPIIASNNSAFPETVGNAGILIDGTPGSKEYIRSFSDACIELLSDRNMWGNFSQNGLLRSREFFSWDNVAKKFMDIVNLLNET
jgi:glycosyltransferase involved in cell wall biosynthesis